MSKPKRRQQRRMRHETGNLSIGIFLAAVTWIALCSPIHDSQAAYVGRQNSVGADGEDAKLQKVGDDFEALMLQFMYTQMQQANAMADDGDNPFAPSPAEKIYRGMQDEETMKRIAGTRPLGFGNLVTRQLKGEGGIGDRALVRSPENSSVPAR